MSLRGLTATFSPPDLYRAIVESAEHTFITKTSEALSRSKDDVNGKAASTWIMLTENEADFLSLRAKFMTSAKDEKPWYRFEDDVRWHPEERRQRSRPDVGVWTDDFSSIVQVFRTQ